MEITKEFVFDSAHQLDNYDGPCARLHGHTYKLLVTVGGKLNDIGMVMDFGDLKDIVGEKVLKKLDHYFLNEIISQPTAENIAVWIWNEIKPEIEKNKSMIKLVKIKLWETPKSYVVYRGELL